MKDDIIKQTLDFLGRIYPGTPPGPEAADAWRLACWDVAPEVLREAAIEYSRTAGKRFFPTPGELLEIADSWVPGFSPHMSIAQAVKVTTGRKRAEIDPGVMQVIENYGVDDFRKLGERPGPTAQRHWRDASKKQAVAVKAREAAQRRDSRLTPKVQVSARQSSLTSLD